jgi:cationic peptide transport system substrate-binding protein
MVSQLSHSMEEAATYILIGTGPFKLESLAADGTRTYVRNDDYWMGPADISKMIWIVNTDTDSKMAGLLGGEYDFAGPGTQYFDQIRADETLTFQGPVSSQIYYYIGFNTQTISISYRKAMAYAYNYTWLIEEFYEGTRNYMYTPVAPGIPFSKTDCDYPVLDLAIARQTLIDDVSIDTHGLDMTSTDEEWLTMAETNPIAYFNFSHYVGWEDVAASTVGDMAHIGIEIEAFGILDDPMDQLINTPANWIYVDLFLLGWGPDYLDPHNMIAEAFAGEEQMNPMQVAGNFPLLQDLIDEGLLEMDVDLRRQIYYDQQTMIIEEIIPWIMLMTRTEFAAYTTELSNYPLNPSGDLYFYPCIWNPAEPAAPPVQAIPGYNVIALFGAIAIASMFLVKKRRK